MDQDGMVFDGGGSDEEVREIDDYSQPPEVETEPGGALPGFAVYLDDSEGIQPGVEGIGILPVTVIRATLPQRLLS